MMNAQRVEEFMSSYEKLCSYTYNQQKVHKGYVSLSKKLNVRTKDWTNLVWLKDRIDRKLEYLTADINDILGIK
jgi:hypothetical protein